VTCFRKENIKLDHVQTAWKGVEWIPLYVDHWWVSVNLVNDVTHHLHRI
jgi:hypothetical protein